MQLKRFPFQKLQKGYRIHAWPKCQELENAVERAVILAEKGMPIEADLLGLKSNLRVKLLNPKNHLIRKILHRWKK